jgi:hypothetical protein
MSGMSGYRIDRRLRSRIGQIAPYFKVRIDHPANPQIVLVVGWVGQIRIRGCSTSPVRMTPRSRRIRSIQAEALSRHADVAHRPLVDSVAADTSAS